MMLVRREVIDIRSVSASQGHRGRYSPTTIYACVYACVPTRHYQHGV